MSTRDLSIKTKVLQRLRKEHAYYITERDKQQGRIDEMIKGEKDEHDIKKQREVLEETLDMLPDVERRIKSARLDLETLVTNASDDLKKTSEYNDAVRDLDAMKD